jgi:hypothetical protein
MNQQTLTLGASFTLGLFGGYLVNRYWFLIRTILGLKPKRTYQEKPKKLQSQTSVENDKNNSLKKNDDTLCGDVESESGVGFYFKRIVSIQIKHVF